MPDLFKWFRQPAPTVSAQPDPQPDEKVNAIRLFAYNESEVKELELKNVQEIAQYKGKFQVIWVDFEGLPDEAALDELTKMFKLHSSVKDCLVKRPEQLARMEQYASQRMVTTTMFQYHGRRLREEPVTIVFEEGFVLSFQLGYPGDCFDIVRNRIRQATGRLRKEKGTFLACALLDAIIESYYHIVELNGDLLDDLQDDILVRHDRTVPGKVHNTKRDIVRLRHAIWPLRDALTSYHRDVGHDLSQETRHYLRDCIDTAVRVISVLETNRELCADLMELHLSTASARMNEVMKVLTIITTLFIPPTFIAGIYGMNFNPDKSPWNMPELNWFWGYPFALVLMFSLVVGLAVFLYRRGCFQREVSPEKQCERAHCDNDDPCCKKK